MSDWIGPTWAQWASTVNRVNEAYADLESAQKTAQDWKRYALRLEKELDEVWDLYREAQGNASGQRVLRENVDKELREKDPGNRMLDKDHRQNIFNKAKGDELKVVDDYRKQR